MRTIISVFFLLNTIQGFTQKNAIWKIKDNDSLECEFKGWAINSIFYLPILRYNINSFNGEANPPGNLEYFNSLGAGVAFSFGKIHVKSTQGTNLNNCFDSEKTVTMKNVCGVSFGVLFSKSDSIGGSRIIFAPNINIQILDFQIGWGYELGTVANNAHRNILTLSYGLPLTKFTDAGSYLLRNRVRIAGAKNKDMRGFF